MKRIYPLLALLWCLCLAGCDDEKKDVTDSVVIMTAPVTVPADAGTRSITISATRSWTAQANDWITPDPASGGRGIHVVSLRYRTNDTGELRSGAVTFAAGTYSEDYVLSQKAE